MNLPSAVTITPPTITRPDGAVREFAPFTVDALDITIIDNEARRHAYVSIRRFPRPVTIWQGDDYDAAGDYTQADAEARLLEVLGPDVQAGLQALYPPAP